MPHIDYKEIGRRIELRRKDLGLTLTELASTVDLAASTIQRYEKGSFQRIKLPLIEAIAEALHVNPEWLLGKTDDPTDYDDGDILAEVPLSYMELCNNDPRRAQAMLLAVDEDAAREAAEMRAPTLPPNAIPIDVSKWHQIPILGRISAGLPIYADEHIEGYTLTELNSGAEYFALRVHGDSMNALGINDGYLIIVRRQEEVEQGEVAVVLVDEEDATVKRFYSSDTTVTLMPQSTNPIHGPQMYDLRSTPIRVLGKVVEVKFTL